MSCVSRHNLTLMCVSRHNLTLSSGWRAQVKEFIGAILASVNTTDGWVGPGARWVPRGLSSTTLALITSDCGFMQQCRLAA